MIATLDAAVHSAQDLRAAFRATGSTRRVPDLSRLDRVLRIDEGGGSIEVQAAAAWPSLAAFLTARGLEEGRLFEQAACHDLPATLGECVARNAAMPDGTPFITHVESLTIVASDGELRCATRERHPDWFRAVNGGHGMIAAVYSITLRIPSLARAFANADAAVTLSDSAAEPAAGERMRLMVPPDGLAPFLAELRNAFEDYRLSIAGLSVRRALADKETFLRWASEELAVVDVSFRKPLTLPARVAATQIRKRLIGAALAQGGRFDLATGMDASREQVEAAYPMFSAFLAAKRRYDPRERLGGPWYRHYEALLRREPLTVRWSKA